MTDDNEWVEYDISTDAANLMRHMTTHKDKKLSELKMMEAQIKELGSVLATSVVGKDIRDGTEVIIDVDNKKVKIREPTGPTGH